MKDYVILADTTADIDCEIQEKYNIEVLTAHLVIDGKEQDSFLKWENVSREEFYADLKKNPSKYKTAPPSSEEMKLKFEEFVKEDKGIIYITMSSGISGTCNFALNAKKLLLEEQPDAKIIIIDSLRFGPAIGLMAVNASILRSQGKTMEEVENYLTETKNCYHQAGWLDDLSFVAKQGRINHAQAFFGTLIGIKPIGEFDFNGMTTVLGKAKGEKQAFEVLINYIEKTIKDPEKQIIFIAHTSRFKQAEKYKQMIEEKFHPLEVAVKDVYPSCGINIGPGLMAAYYVGTPISEDLEFEKKIVSESLEG